MKRKKVLIVVACICLLAVFCSICWFVPVLRYEIFGIPFKTDVFLPPSDVTMGFYAGEETLLSEAQSEEISQAFEALISGEITCEPMEKELKWYRTKSGSSLCLFFQYKHPYRYAGDFKALNTVNSWEFEALGVVITENEIVVIIFSDYESEREEAQIKISVGEADMAEFERIVSRTIAQGITNPMKLKRQSDSAWPAIETEKLFVVPDTVVVKNAEQSTVLSVEQENQVYDAFLSMQNTQALPITGPYGRREIYTPEAVYEEIESHPCVEFRYDKSYRFEGVFAQLRSETADEELKDMEWTVEFDSIVLILYENGAMMVFGKNGLYKSVISFYRKFDFGPGYVDFRAEVLSLIV